MNTLAKRRGRLVWKLLLTYLIVISVGVIVLAAMVILSAPQALDRHMAAMQSILQNVTGNSPIRMSDLRDDLMAAVHEILIIAGGAAILAAIIASVLTARRIVEPIDAMTQASRHIAAGDYHRRVQMPSDDELGTLAHSFNQMAETLEKTEQRRVELIGDVAHELRTPLSSIRSTMEGLMDGVLPADSETFDSVEREVARLQRLVHDLDELSRAESGQMQLDLQPARMDELIEVAVERLRAQYEDKNVRIDTHISSRLPEVRLDASRFTQVLVNLLGNALHYTLEGGSVTVEAKREGCELVVAVHDTGIGIATEHLPHLFERFYRVDKSRSRAGGGSGIGLTIAKHIVETHGGRIWASSPGIGQGSTFSFALPFV